MSGIQSRTGVVEIDNNLLDCEGERRAVCVETDDSAGSGVIVDQNLVIVTLHTLRQEKGGKKFYQNLRVNGLLAKIIGYDSNLAALEVATERIGPVGLVYNLQVGEKVYYVNKLDLVERAEIRHGVIQRSTYKHFFASMGSDDGSCGSALWFGDKVAGILNTDKKDNTTTAVRASYIAKLLLKIKVELKVGVLPFEAQQWRMFGQ